MTRDAILALVDELEAKARRATPGPYEAWVCDDTGAGVTQGERGDIVFGVTFEGEPDSGDAEFYAALWPERLLALLSFVREVASGAPAASPAPHPDPEVDWEAVRDEVAHAVERTSLREMADVLGISASGLAKFVGGAMPYQKTRRKYLRWFMEDDGRARTDDAVLRAATVVILRHVPPGRREEASRILSDLTSRRS
jgi:hypothetical protein